MQKIVSTPFPNLDCPFPQHVHQYLQCPSRRSHHLLQLPPMQDGTGRRSDRSSVFAASHAERATTQSHRLCALVRNRHVDTERATVKTLHAVTTACGANRQDETGATESGPGRLGPAFVTALSSTELGPSESDPTDLGPV